MEKIKLFRNYFVPCIALLFFMVGESHAASATEIDIKVDSAVKRFANEVDTGQAFLKAAKGVLIFPNVVKAGFGIGGEYGEGAMRISGKTVDYYNTAAASIGFQIGAQTKTIILVFLEDKALNTFRASDGWEAGVDGAVALIQIGAGGSIDTSNVTDPIVGFVLNNKGLMYNLTLEGSKMTKIKK
ncbi:MAG: lipid-binding SYLF domain-containing protein [Gammaproteobacteria bacterium]|jgi:lipid-binding SYLF domain-containing protein